MYYSSIDIIKSAYHVFAKVLQRWDTRLSIYTAWDIIHSFSYRYSEPLILINDRVYKRGIIT